jgi:hypothetical protein
MNDDKPTHLLVAGRSLDNYHEFGDPLEPDSYVEPCVLCKRLVAIRPEGRQRLERGRAEGLKAAMVCSRCALMIPNGGVHSVEMTSHADEQAAKNPRVREAIEFMKGKQRR